MNDTVKNPWFECIHRVLNIIIMWFFKYMALMTIFLKNAVAQKLKDQFIQTWSNDMFDSSNGKMYRTFKLYFGCEKYLEKLPDYSFEISYYKSPPSSRDWLVE